jgi:DNA-binding transcriptional LysR family regulator
MNIEMLDTFLDLRTTRNFNRTADNLMVTQSTVSARVRGLEEELGVRLFVRGRGGAQLTPEGEKFESYAINLRLGWNLARQDLAMPAGYHGRLRVAMQVSLWDILLNGWVAELRRVLSHLAVHVESDYSDAMVDAIVFGNLEIAVMYTPQYRPGLSVEHLFDERFSMVATRALALEDVHVEDYVLNATSPHFKARHSELLPRLQHAPLSMGLSNMNVDYLRAHGGVTYLPERMSRPLTASGEFHPVKGAPVIPQPVFVTCLSRNRNQPSVARALELLAAVDLNAGRHTG